MSLTFVRTLWSPDGVIFQRSMSYRKPPLSDFDDVMDRAAKAFHIPRDSILFAGLEGHEYTLEELETILYNAGRLRDITIIVSERPVADSYAIPECSGSEVSHRRSKCILRVNVTTQ